MHKLLIHNITSILRPLGRKIANVIRLDHQDKPSRLGIDHPLYKTIMREARNVNRWLSYFSSYFSLKKIMIIKMQLLSVLFLMTANVWAAEKAILTSATELFNISGGSALLTSRTAYTIELWVKFGTTPDTEQGLFEVAGSGFGSTTGYFGTSSNKMAVHLNTSAGSAVLSSVTINSATGVTMTTGAWYHFAYVFDNGAHRFYFNGTKVGSDVADPTNTATVPAYTASDILLFARSVSGFLTNFHGHMDDIRVWKTARSDAEISITYNADSPTEYAPLTDADLVAYWTLNDTSGTTVTDSQTGNTKYNGILGTDGATFAPSTIGEVGKVSAAISNNTPVITVSNVDLTYSENDAATQIDSTATLTDADGDADWNGGTLVVQITANNEADDTLTIPDVGGAINTSVMNILDNATVIGTMDASEGTVSNGTALTITFNASATNARVQSVLQAISYSNTSNDPGVSSRTITFTATDTNSAAASDTRTVSFTSLNDEPSLTATGSSPTFTQGGGAQSLFSSAAASTVESGETLTAMSLTVTNVSDGANEVLSFDGSNVQLTDSFAVDPTTTNGLNVSVSLSGSTATVSFSGESLTEAQLNTLIDSITYTNSAAPPNTTSRVFTITSLTDNGASTGANDNVNGALALTSTVTVVKLAPSITSATYDASTGALVVLGTNFENDGGSDVTINNLTITGENGATYQLTAGTSTEITDSTHFTVTVTGTDKLRLDALLNKDGSVSDGITAYKLAAADDFIAAVTAGDTADLTGNGITVSNYANPRITSALYNANSGELVVTGTKMSSVSAANSDVIANAITLSATTGDSYTLTDTANVDITSASTFTVTLSAVDKHNVNGILNKDLQNADDGKLYNIAVADNWMAGGALNVDIADSSTNGVTVSNSANPVVTSATYDATTGVLVATGTNFVNKVGASDIDLTQLTLKGEGTNTHTLTAVDVEITDATSFSVTLIAADKIIVNGLLNKNLTVADDTTTTYNLDAADNYMVAARTSQGIADATNVITVSNVVVPAITSATYDASTKAMVVTGTGFARQFGGDDINVAKLSLVGQTSGEYPLTSANVEITSETEFTVTLSDADKINVNGLLNKDSTQAGDNTVYNLKGAENWQQGAATGAVIVDNGVNAVTVSSTAVPTVSSATYDYASGVLVVTGTRMVKKPSTANDVDLTKLTITGQASGTRTLTTTNVELTDEASFSVTLNTADKTAVNALLNLNGTQSGDSVTYNLNAAEDWIANADVNAAIVDATANLITVSNVPVPTLTDAAYDASTGSLLVTGTNFEAKSGTNTDVTISKLTLTGEGGISYTLATSSDVDITDSTSFTVNLAGADRAEVAGLLNKDGTQADSGASFILTAADDFMANITAGNTADASNTVTVSNYANPVITTTTYDFATGALVVSGTGFSSVTGGTNDIDPTKLTLTGDSGNTYVLTSSAVEVTDTTAFTVTLNATDKLVVSGLLNTDGTQSGSGQTYNIAAADNWMAGGAPNVDIKDLTSNGITVSNVSKPVVSDATYNAGSGVLVVTGTNFVNEFGSTNDVDPTQFSLLGDSSGTYTLTTTPAVEITDDTTFTLTLSAVDITNVNGLLNKNGTASSGNITYNLAVADRWMPGATVSTDMIDSTGNGITVSGVVDPAISTVAYDATSGVLSVTGTNFINEIGATNDVDLTKFTLSGEAGGSTVVTTTSVEITSATAFSATLSTADKLIVNGLLNKNGANAGDNTLYNLAAAEGWMPGAASSPGIVDGTTGITVSNVPIASITLATYAADTGTLIVTGSNFVSKSGSTNDIDVTKLTLNGEGNNTYTLTTTNVDIIDANSFSVVLNVTDKANINGLLNKNDTTADDGATYNLAAAEDWLAGAAASAVIADLTNNAITVSGVAIPTITSATYDATTGDLVVTGTRFVNHFGSTNDIDISLLTLTGENGASYGLTSTSDIEISAETSFTVTLTGADKTHVDGLLNKNGTVSDTTSTVYNLAGADNWMAGAANTTDIADLTSNTITVANVTVPSITSAIYDATTGIVVVTGTNLRNNNGATNDVDISLFTFTGDGGSSYTVTSTSDIEITSGTGFTFTLSGADKTHVDGLLEKNGVTSDSGATYNLAGADNWMLGAAASTDIKDLSSNGITVSNVTVPALTSATYDFTTGVLLATGTNLRNKAGSGNDVDLTKLALKGEGNNSYTLTGSSVEITSSTEFTATLNDTDKINVNGLLNKDGSNAEDNVLYNLAAADNWMAGAATASDVADATSGVTVSSVVTPSITSITYDYTTGVVTITGLNFVKKFGNANDVDISLLTFTGENGVIYTLTSAVDIELTSSTSFTFTLSGADLTGVNALVTANGTSAGSGQAYNVAAADDWMAGTAISASIADTTGNAVTVTNAPTPTITSATYDASTATLTVTGTNYVAKSGETNDVAVSKLTLKGQAAGTYTLTSSDVEITNGTSFSVTLNVADKLNINGLLNTDGTLADDSTAYNIAAADDFIAETSAGDSSDNTGNAITVSGVAIPTITSATYDATSGVLAVTGTNLVHEIGATNDVDISLMTITGEAGASYVVTSASDVEITDGTSLSITLAETDKTNVDGLLNKNGTSSDNAGTTYNLAIADNWMTGAASTLDIADTTENGITVSNVTIATITSATYDATSGALVVTGTNLRNNSDATNDVDISTLTLTGEGGATYTLTSTTDVEITSSTEFTVTLSGSDKTNIDGLLNKNGTTSDSSVTTYNLAGADNWLPGSAVSTDISDATNGVTVSNVTVPTITSAVYDGTSGILTVSGSNFRNKSGAINDVDVSLLTLKGQALGTHTLTTTDVEITDSNNFTIILNNADKAAIEPLLNNTSTSAYDDTLYNIAAVDNWMAGAAASTDIADATNGINVSSVITPSVTLSASSSNIVEAAGTSVLTATLSAITSANVTINVGLTYTGTGVLNTDYSTTGDSISISKGVISGSVTVQALPDNLSEGNKTIIADITSTSNATENDAQTQTINIIDDEGAPTVTLTASSNAISETGGSTTLTATSSVATTADITVGLAYSGTATNGSDYGTGATSITITAGQTTGTTTLSTTSDSSVEASETLIVDISSVTGGASNSATENSIQQQTITISDDDTATVTLAVSSNTIAEAAGTATATATLSQATFENVIVSLGYSGTATNGTDYATPASSITIVAGQTTGTTTLTATVDASVEASETIIVTITGVSGGSVSESGTQTQTVSVIDDDVATVSLTASTNSIAEAAGTSTITATLTSATYENVTISLGYTGTASSTDYSASATSITIAAGQTTGTVTLTATVDASVEAGETIIVDITGVSGGSASESGTQQQTVTITDDDTTSVTLTASTNTIAEAAGTSTVTATLDKVSFESVTVNLGFSGTAGSTDYTASATSITIAAGQTTGTATLTATQDTNVEGDQTVIIDITSVSGGSASESGSQQQTLTITDDETVNVSLSVDLSAIAEGGGNAIVTATLNEATFDSVTVGLGYSGTATSGVDYINPASSITIIGGQISASTTVTAIQDPDEETDETIIVDISSVSGGNANENGAQQQTVSITNDDDQTDPTSYTVTIDAININASNTNNLSFSFSNAEIGATYRYTLTDSSGSITSTQNEKVAQTTSLTQSDSGTVTAADQTISNIDISDLADGLITLQVTLTDLAGNVGAAATASVNKDTLLPTTISLAPENNGADVVIRPDLVLSFNEDVFAGTSDNLIEVHNGATDAVVESIPSGSSAVNISDRVVSITLGSDLSGSSSYYIKVAPGAFVDSVGNAYAGIINNSNWRFTVVTLVPGTTDDTASTSEDDSVAIDVLNNDPGEGNDINPASVTVQTAASNGSTSINTANGVITYTPSTDFNGADTFTYIVTDLAGKLMPAATVTITIASINDAPTAANDSAVSAEDSQVVIDVLANDTDIDATSGEIDTGSVTVTIAPEHGQTSVNSGQITYQPEANYSGSDIFSYTVSDITGAVSNVATVSINVTGTNDAPSTVVDTIATDEDVAVTINVLANDTDIDGQLDASSVAILTQPGNGSVAVQGDGSLLYTPRANFFGADTLTYTVKDDLDAVSSATQVTITVNAVNDAPVAFDDTVIVLEDVAHIINVIGNDTDVDSAIVSISLVSAPTSGSVSITDLQLTYTPGDNFSGADSFTYLARDADGAASNTATVTLTIEAVNDAPLANNDSVQTDEDQAVEINVLANDSDIDGQVDETSVQIVTAPSNGSAQVSADGLITYTPASNFSGTDQLAYQISDNQGAESTATVTIQINEVNDQPSADDLTITTDEDVSVSIILGGSDVDDDPLDFTLITSPANGTLTGTAPNLTYQPDANFSGADSFTFMVNDEQLDSVPATVTINVNALNDAPIADAQTVQAQEDTGINIILSGSDPEGDALSFTLVSTTSHGQLDGTGPNLSYQPNPNFSGTDSFTFSVDDGVLNSTTATVTIIMAASNDQPVANSLSVSVAEDQSTSFTLTGSDIDGDGLSFTVINAPLNGVLSGQPPNLQYTPDGDFNGTDSFTFAATDGGMNSAPASVDIIVTSINDDPLAANDSLSRDNWLSVDIDVLANDFDVDGDLLTILGASVDSGSLTFSNSVITYTPISGFIGSAVIDYQVTDNQGATDNALVFVEINVSDNDLPVVTVPADIRVNADALSTKVDLGVATAVDRLGNPLPVSLVDGTTFFKPGVNTVFWQTTDSEDRTATASQVVNVDPLISVDKDQTTLEGFSATVGVRLNGLSPDYPLSIPYSVGGTAESGVDHNLTDGTITIDSGTEGLITFNIFADNVFEGEETIIVELGSALNRGSKFSQTITISEENVDPKVELLAEQAGEERFIISLDDDVVVIRALVTHPDAANQYSFQWSNKQEVLIDIDNDEDTYSFDPAGLDLGIYHVNLIVVDVDDTEYTGRKQITLKLEQTTVVLTSDDADNDGVPDNVEGLGDGDNDGIPDYLDAIPECNVLPELVGSTDEFLVEGDPGVCLRLGDTALGGESGGARIITDADGQATGAPDELTSNVGGIFDFIAYGLPQAGQTYRIVMPQVVPIPANAIYRKVSADGVWRDFVENERDQLWSTAGESGFCPPPGDERWQQGLVEGYWCVQLLITDGGPNDDDGEANSTIIDPGGVSVVIDNNNQPQVIDDVASTRFNTSLIIDVLSNDTDADADSLSVNSANATFGSVEIVDNQLSYQPALNFFGLDTVVYGVTDGQGGSNSGTLTVSVIANENPVAQSDTGSVITGQLVTIDVLSNDTDPENDTLSVIAASADNGSVTITNDQQLTYQANGGFTGVDRITYRIRDALGGESSGFVEVTVSAATTAVKAKTTGGGSMAWLLLVCLTIAGLRRSLILRAQCKGKQ
jgi:hypothetical protein